MNTNSDFQKGLLHFVHLLVTVDGKIDDRERVAIAGICKEEGISEETLREFEATVYQLDEREIYSRGAKHLSNCTEEERLTAFVHLYRLAEADTSISNKEVKFLLFGLKAANISFEDVILSAGLSGNRH